MSEDREHSSVAWHGWGTLRFLRSPDGFSDPGAEIAHIVVRYGCLGLASLVNVTLLFTQAPPCFQQDPRLDMRGASSLKLVVPLQRLHGMSTCSVAEMLNGTKPQVVAIPIVLGRASMQHAARRYSIGLVLSPAGRRKRAVRAKAAIPTRKPTSIFVHTCSVIDM